MNYPDGFGSDPRDFGSQSPLDEEEDDEPDECECPKEERTYSGFVIIHNSRENCYTCNLCGKVH